jgi:hypothetical protein
MAEPRTRLGKILQQEYQSKGVVGGVMSALGKRSLEKLDIRNSLFGGSGLGSVIGQKIFGKGYSATRKTGASGVESVSELSQNLNSSVLEEINANSRISAKNSVVLPSMARDMNLMRMNIIKLVKLQGGTPSMKADMFFNRAKEREMLFENQFAKNKISKNSKTPEKIAENKNIFQSILDGLGGTFLPLLMGRVIAVLSSPTVIASLAALVGLIALSRTTPGKLFPKLADSGDLQTLNKALSDSQTEKGRKNMVKEAEDFAKRALPKNKPSEEDIQGVREGKKIFYNKLNRETGLTEPVFRDVQEAAKESQNRQIGNFDLEDYAARVGELESGSNYESDNGVGFIGKYQFGSQALETFGYLKPGSSKKYGATGPNAAVYHPDAWSKSSLQDFLYNVSLQEQLFKKYTLANLDGLKKAKIVTETSTPNQIGEALYTAHVGGVGGAKDLFLKGKSRNDFLHGEKGSTSTSRNKMAASYEGGKPSSSGAIVAAGSNTNTNANNTGAPVVLNTNNITNNSGGGSSGQLSSADVMDTELGRLLLTRMY